MSVEPLRQPSTDFCSPAGTLERARGRGAVPRRAPRRRRAGAVQTARPARSRRAARCPGGFWERSVRVSGGSNADGRVRDRRMICTLRGVFTTTTSTSRALPIGRGRPRTSRHRRVLGPRAQVPRLSARPTGASRARWSARLPRHRNRRERILPRSDAVRTPGGASTSSTRGRHAQLLRGAAGSTRSSLVHEFGYFSDDQKGARGLHPRRARSCDPRDAEHHAHPANPSPLIESSATTTYAGQWALDVDTRASSTTRGRPAWADQQIVIGGSARPSTGSRSGF